MAKIRDEEKIEDINIMPLMNIVMLLIPFLLMSTEFIKIGVVNVVAPKIGGSTASAPEEQKKPEKPPLNLTVSITDKGLTLITRGDKIPEGCDLDALKQPGEKKLPTMKKIGNNHNYIALTQCLDRIKKLFSDEKRIILMAEPEIKFEVIVALMDASRESTAFPIDPKANKDGLFPEVILSAGVL